MEHDAGRAHARQLVRLEEPEALPCGVEGHPGTIITDATYPLDAVSLDGNALTLRFNQPGLGAVTITASRRPG